jgi:Fe-S-cluster containining protein
MSECVRCGACCAAYRVEFAVYEIDSQGGGVPEALTEEVNGVKCRMRGTGAVPIRCVALRGDIGRDVGCAIYHHRPAPCHELQEGSHACHKARARHGLPPLTDTH